MNGMSAEAIAIRHFQAGDEAAFRGLNEDWIRRYFKLEAKDEHSLADPRTTIIEPGGEILMALSGVCAIGCCALLKIHPGTFEVAKMAVDPAFQGMGIGRQLLRATIAEARRLGAQKLFLETNHMLTPAIHLYESLGFQRLDRSKLPPSPYERSDVAMELLLESD